MKQGLGNIAVFLLCCVPAKLYITVKVVHNKTVASNAYLMFVLASLKTQD